MTTARHKTEAHKIPKPRAASAKLLEAADVRLPEVLPNQSARVVTKRKLPPRRTNP